MFLKKVLNYNFPLRLTRVHAKKGVSSLYECDATITALKRDCWCLHSYMNYSLPILYSKKRTHFEVLTANASSSTQVSSKKELSFKSSDQIPKDFTLIYKAAIDNYIVYSRRCNIVGAVCLFGIGLIKLNVLTWGSKTTIDQVAASVSYLSGDTEFLLVYLVLVTCVSTIHMVASMSPLRLYHNPDTDKYIGVFANIFGLPMKYYFDKAEVKKLKPSGVLPWKDSKFLLKSKKCVLLSHYFRLPSDYNALLGVEFDDD